MKRVLLIDLDATTLEDLKNIEKELEKRKRVLQKIEDREKEKRKEDRQKRDIIEIAIHLFQKNDNLFDVDEDPDVAMKCAFTEAYNMEGANVWIEFDPQLDFGDRPPCMVDDGWCCGNLDRVGELTFYRNLFNKDWIICGVDLDNRRAPECEEVVVDMDWIIEEMQKGLKK